MSAVLLEYWYDIFLGEEWVSIWNEITPKVEGGTAPLTGVITDDTRGVEVKEPKDQQGERDPVNCENQ